MHYLKATRKVKFIHKLKGTVNDINKAILACHPTSPAFQPNALKESTRGRAEKYTNVIL